MSAPYRIRPARAADLDRIVAIEKASFDREAYDRQLFVYYLERCGLFLVAGRGKTVSAYMITCLGGNGRQGRAELVSVAVDPRVRKRGVASALLESTLRRLRRRGAARLNLVVRVKNRPAQAFYAKYGFRRVRIVRGYYEDGGDGIAMRLEIGGAPKYLSGRS